jgi:general secretion pathway protein L
MMGSRRVLQNIAVIRLIQDRLAWYPPGASDEPRWLDNDTERERLRATLSQRLVTPCFAVPGADVRLLTLPVTAQEKKHIGKSLPFMLEEQVATDIEALHFASMPLDKESFAVAVCALDKMPAWQALLADYPGISSWIPEPLLLPWQAGEWCIVLEDEGAIVRTGYCEGSTIEREMLPVLLASALADETTVPATVIVYGHDQVADTALLPVDLQDKVQWRAGNLYSALMLGDSDSTTLSLLQGEFAPRLPLARWWRQWRAVAAVFAAACAMHLLATYADYRNLKSENLALRTAVQDSYRKAYPKGAMVDAEKQLRRQLDAMRGSAQTSGFVSLIDRVGSVIASRPGTTIATINYSDKSDEMRMNIVAADFEAVEQMRADINNAGLQAVMESSSAQGDRVRARLRVSERS